MGKSVYAAVLVCTSAGQGGLPRTRLSRNIGCTRYAQLGTVTCSLGA